MANKNRICSCCGLEYRWCSHCNDFDPTESWKYLYHDKKCQEIAHILRSYRGNEITKAEAKEKLSKIKPNIDNVLKNDSVTANEIKDIFGIVKPIVTTAAVATEEQVDDIKDVKQNNFDGKKNRQFHDKNENKKN